MGWLVMLVLALLVGLGLWRFGGFRRTTLELLGAALLLGVAGYAWQGSPGLAGKPTQPPADSRQPDSAFTTQRATMMERFGGDAQILEAADAMHRQGWHRYAIALIKGGLEKKPRSADLWVGLGNALVIHGGGMMSPAAQLAFERAARINPEHPGPPFFMGLAYAQAGQLDQAEAVWRGLLARAPADASWRADLEQRLAMIEAARARR
ncbi:MAG: Cytochrome c biosis factor-like protein [Sphingomonas bacterium]|nr:Cytochrome c biosis factor-like protein [Sphingomonas bacterium]MDB5717385.1 Cytochrome c biosis factor-like protein [Sphingomonas bacterium]